MVIIGDGIERKQAWFLKVATILEGTSRDSELMPNALPLR
jgi:hypothetical protein